MKPKIEEISTNLFDTDTPYATVRFDHKSQDKYSGIWLEVQNTVIEVTLEDFDFNYPSGDQLKIESVYFLFEEAQSLLFSDDSLIATRIGNSDWLHDIAETIAEYWFEHIDEWTADRQADKDDYYYEQAKDRRMEEALKEMEA